MSPFGGAIRPAARRAHGPRRRIAADCSGLGIACAGGRPGLAPRSVLPGGGMQRVLASELVGMSGRTAVVAGGSKGVGQALAGARAEAGADVVIVARKAEELRAALETILAGTSSRGAWIAADLADRGALARVADEATAAFGKI